MGRRYLMRPVLAVLAVFLLLAGCKEELYSDLSQHEANLMVATLSRHGIPADRRMTDAGQMAVRVDKAQFANAVDVLDRAGLPMPEFTSMGEVFEQQGLVASPMQEQMRMLYAMSEELSRTVSEIDGVLSARVHIVLPENDPLRRNSIPSSASVFLRYNPDIDIEALVPKVKNLVANAVAGLSYESVSVVTVAAIMPREGPALQPMRDFLGVSVQEASYARALWIFGLALALAVGASAMAGYFAWRARRPVSYALEAGE